MRGGGSSSATVEAAASVTSAPSLPAASLVLCLLLRCRLSRHSLPRLRMRPAAPRRFWDTRASKNTATVSTPGANLYLAWTPDAHSLAVVNREDVVAVIDARCACWGWRGVPGCRGAARLRECVS